LNLAMIFLCAKNKSKEMNKWQCYEILKKQINKLKLSSDEYEEAIKKLSEVLKI